MPDSDNSADQPLTEAAWRAAMAAETERVQVQLRVEDSLREAVWAMRSSHDLEQVLGQLRSALRDLRISFDHCGVNVIGVGTPVRMLGRQSTDRVSVCVLAPDSPDAIAIGKFVAGGKPVYRSDLERADPFSERERLARLFSEPIRSVVDVPFGVGTLAVNSRHADAFSDAQVAALTRLGSVLGEGFRRQADLMRLEQRTARLQAEAAERRVAEASLRQALVREQAMGRVRARTMTASSLVELEAALGHELVADLRALGVPVAKLALEWHPQRVPAPRGDGGTELAGAGAPDLSSGATQARAAAGSAPGSGEPPPAPGCPNEPSPPRLALSLPNGRMLIAVSSGSSVFDAASTALLEAVASLVGIGCERIEAAAAVAQSDAWLRLHTDPSPLGVVEWDRGFVIRRWTGAAERIFGWSAGEMVGRRLTDIGLVYDADLPAVAAVIERLGGGREPHITSINRNHTKSGHVVWCEWYNTVVTDASGNVVSVLSLVLDATARYEAEAAGRDATDRYRLLYETMSQGVVYQSPTGEIVAANPAAERILGASLADLAGRTSDDARWQALADDGAPMAGSEHPAMVAMREGRPAGPTTMGVYNPALNDRVWIRVTAVPLFEAGASRPNRVYAIFDDITEQRRVEADYRALFREMFDGFALHEVICDDDRPVDYRFIAVNPAFERSTGLSAEAIVGRTALEVWPGLESSWIERYGRVAMGGQPTRFVAHAGPLGRVFEVSAFCPQPKRFACIFVDITATVEADAQRLETERRRQAMLTALPDLLFRMDRAGTILDYKAGSHDLFVSPERGISGRRQQDLLPPEVGALIAEHIREALDSGALQTFGYQLDIPSRGRRSYEARMAPSGPDEVTAIVRDVTDRERQDLHDRVDRSLQTLRTAIAEMGSMGDWGRFVETVDAQLRSVVEFSESSVALVDLATARVRLFWAPQGGNWSEYDFQEVHPALQAALSSQQPVCRRVHNDSVLASSTPADVRTVVDLPFAGGTLAVNRTDEADFTPAEVEVLQQFAGVVAEAAQRLADLEAQQSMQAALAESERLHRSLVEVSPAAIFIHSDGQFVFANPAGARLLGTRSPSDVVGRRVVDFVHPEHLPRVLEHVDQALRSGDTIALSVERLLRVDGGVVDVEIAGTPLVYQGKPAVQIVAYDVTERRRAEEGLAAVDRRYRLLFERSHDAVFMFQTRDGRYLDANAAAVELVGRPRTEITQLTTHRLEATGAEERLEALARSPEAVDVTEVEYLRADGSRRVTLLTAIAVDESVSFGLAHDITERKQTETALRVSLALERVRTAVLQMEAEEDWVSVVRCVKSELRPLMGLDGVSVCLIDPEGRTATNYLPTNAPHLERRTRDFVYPALQQALDTGQPVLRSTTEGFVKYHDPFGADTVGAVVDVPFMVGTLGARVLPGKSISEDDIGVLSEFAQVLLQAHRRLEGIRWRSQAEAELTQKRLLAVRADRLRALGEMASGVAHELNQPLNGIRTFAEGAAISVDRGWDMKQSETLQTFRDIVEQVDRATLIIDHMRDFARKPSPDADIWFDINDPVSGALKLLGTQLRVHGIVVDQQLSPGLPRCAGSANEIEQVVLNLLSNARDAIDDRADRERGNSGRVGSGWMPRITIRTWSDIGAIGLSIADTGGGIPPQLLGQVFDPFFTTKPVGKGTGIGLSIAQGIVEAHGGAIEVDNRPSDGVTFTVRLPIRTRE